LSTERTLAAQYDHWARSRRNQAREEWKGISFCRGAASR
jgi:hypothetical protein